MAKTANLLHDSYGGTDRIGLLLPLHWQAVCLLLGGVAAGATVDVCSSAAQLAGCPVAFVAADQAEEALAAGADEVLACSLTPFGTRALDLPAMALDVAVELPGHGDHFPGRPTQADIRLDGDAVGVGPLPLSEDDRVLTALPPATRAGLTGLLGVLSAGAALILLASGDRDQALAQESATAWLDEKGLHHR